MQEFIRKCPLTLSKRHQPPSKPADLHDLSSGGASVLGLVPLGTIGGRIRLGFDFTLQSTNESVYVELNATIQSLEKVPNGNKNATGAPLHQHGVQFDNADSRIVLLVYELQQEIRYRLRQLTSPTRLQPSPVQICVAASDTNPKLARAARHQTLATAHR